MKTTELIGSRGGSIVGYYRLSSGI